MDLAAHPLTYVRDQLNWSMDDLARQMRQAARAQGLRCGTDRNRVWKWETDRVTPGDESQVLLADVLHVPRTEVARLRWPLWLPAFGQPQPFGTGGIRAALREAVMDRIDRRAFLVFTGTALAATASQWVGTEPHRFAGALDGDALDAPMLDWLEQRTAELRSLSNSSAPLAAEMVALLLRAVVTTIDQARYTDRQGRRLHFTAASLAECLGWHRFDQARHAGAQQQWQAALHASHRADDRDLGAVCLSNLAYQASWMGYPGEAVQILQHAHRRTRSATARSLLDLRQARSLAVLGDRSGVIRTLGRADVELDRARPELAHESVAWMSPADLLADAGRCWLDLGDTTRAQAAITDGLALLDPTRTRTRTVFLAYRAEAALTTHDLPAAATDARTALDTALDTNASRCLDLVRALLGKFTPHTGHPAVADLRDYAHHRLTSAA